MALQATALNLNEQRLAEVDRLCDEFAVDNLVPAWMRERGSEADWEAYLRAERHELRGELAIAVLIGRALRQLDPKTRWEIFLDLTQTLATPADQSDFEAGSRLHKLFNRDGSNGLTEIFRGNLEAACRRALFIDAAPQPVPA